MKILQIPQDFRAPGCVPMRAGDVRSSDDDPIPVPYHPIYRHRSGIIVFPPRCWYDDSIGIIGAIDISRFEGEAEDRLFDPAWRDRVSLKFHRGEELLLVPDLTTKMLSWARGDDESVMEKILDDTLDVWIEHRTLCAIWIRDRSGEEDFSPTPAPGELVPA